MEKSKVYFTDLRMKPGLNLSKKSNNLIVKTKTDQIDIEKKMASNTRIIPENKNHS
ncbi:MAG: hypothetical protein GX876_02465 [Bacteroidales bacterium]|nr:hypothetical protein [Bacteroidales bacterium]